MPIGGGAVERGKVGSHNGHKGHKEAAPGRRPLIPQARPQPQRRKEQARLPHPLPLCVLCALCANRNSSFLPPEVHKPDRVPWRKKIRGLPPCHRSHGADERAPPRAGVWHQRNGTGQGGAVAARRVLASGSGPTSLAGLGNVGKSGVWPSHEIWANDWHEGELLSLAI